MYQGAVVTHHGIPLFRMPLWELLRQTIDGCAAALAEADLAWREGKALDLIREQVVGHYGIKDMKVDENRKERTCGMMDIRLIAEQSPTSEEEWVVRTTFAAVNRRYGTRFRVFIADKDKRGVKEAPQNVKKS